MATPNELGNDGKPVTWVGATDAPGMPGDPTRISVAVATQNYPDDAGQPSFQLPTPSGYIPLAQAAEDVWQALANIRFLPIGDGATNVVQAADIRIGVADLQKGLNPPNINFIGHTKYSWTPNDKLLPDVLVQVENPIERGETKLPDGDFQYSGTQTTVFQDFLREFGHALGLGDNTTDPTSIMYPILTAQNAVPNAADVAAIQAKYGAAKPGAILSQSEIATLHALVPGFVP